MFLFWEYWLSSSLYLWTWWHYYDPLVKWLIFSYATFIACNFYSLLCFGHYQTLLDKQLDEHYMVCPYMMGLVFWFDGYVCDFDLFIL